MNPKGPPLVDLDTAEPAPTRRGLIGMAGLAGAAAALLGASRVAAVPARAPMIPDRPTESDRARLGAAMRLELAARDLYAVSTASLGGDEAVLARVVSENHEAYADAIAGVTGISADDRNNEVFDALVGDFDTSDGQAFAAAARTLENTAVATHTELMASYDSIDSFELTASIVAVEARHAAVFTSMAGFSSDLDEMLDPEATALDTSGGAA
ncbi:MAG: hypothetical protein HKN44_05115 [Ilumatobacter sp.]|nr:hypothetical protein [Ilumatobacter sp.]